MWRDERLVKAVKKIVSADKRGERVRSKRLTMNVCRLLLGGADPKARVRRKRLFVIKESACSAALEAGDLGLYKILTGSRQQTVERLLFFALHLGRLDLYRKYKRLYKEAQ